MLFGCARCLVDSILGMTEIGNLTFDKDGHAAVAVVAAADGVGESADVAESYVVDSVMFASATIARPLAEHCSAVYWPMVADAGDIVPVAMIRSVGDSECDADSGAAVGIGAGYGGDAAAAPHGVVRDAAVAALEYDYYRSEDSRHLDSCNAALCYYCHFDFHTDS